MVRRVASRFPHPFERRSGLVGYAFAMTRPCFLVVDQEYAASISTRKLVIETAKFNVITAYSGAEALATVRRFPAVNGIVLDAGVKDMASEELVRRLKEVEPKIPVIVVGRPGTNFAKDADYHLASFDPAEILALLKKLQPEESAKIEEKDEHLRD